MKLEKWVQIAEIIGAAAIVVSLVFVGLQVRVFLQKRHQRL